MHLKTQWPGKTFLILPLLLLTLLSGCAAVVVTGAVVSIQDRRSAGTQIDDSVIEFKAGEMFRKHEQFKIGSGNRVRPVSYNGTLLLVGEVKNQSLKNQAEDLAYEVPQIRRIVNELEIQPIQTLSQRSQNVWLTSKAKTKLLSIDESDFNPLRVKVLVIRHTAYLMGLLTVQEQARVVDTIRHTRGINKVVKVFETISEPANVKSSE